MAAFNSQTGGISFSESYGNGMKRARGDLTGFAPSPSEAVYLVSPFMIDESSMIISSSFQSSVDDVESRADARAIMSDFVQLSSTGHCMYESMSRGISQRVWVMSNNQRGAYFEKMAQIIRGYQHDPEISSLLHSFCKGSPLLTSLGQHLMDAYTLITKNAEAMTARHSPGIGFANRSPWTMYISGGIDTQRQHSVTLDDRKWVSPNTFTPSLSVEQSMEMNNMQHSSSSDEVNTITLDKMNARKKTVSALNRMKQFVVPSSKPSDYSASTSSAGGSVKTESPHVSPSLQSLSTLPNFPFNVRPSFPMHNHMYCTFPVCVRGLIYN